MMAFQEKYQRSILEIEVVKKLLEEGKLVIREGNLLIPDRYFYLANEILINFI